MAGGRQKPSEGDMDIEKPIMQGGPPLGGKTEHRNQFQMNLDNNIKLQSFSTPSKCPKGASSLHDNGTTGEKRSKQ